jgi:hypothetical protein
VATLPGAAAGPASICLHEAHRFIGGPAVPQAEGSSGRRSGRFRRSAPGTVGEPFAGTDSLQPMQLIATLAAWLPARRAADLDPNEALRVE